MLCTKCNANILDNVKFCPKCGTKVEVKAQETRKCLSCGAENPVSAKFCRVDGYNLQQVEGKIAEKPIEIEQPKDALICLKCGTTYPLSIKFCRKDGAPLQKTPTVKEEIKYIEPKEDVKPEAVIEAKVSEVAPVMKQEEKPAEKMLETEKLKDVILCPKCGTPNTLTAKFCKKDGTLLKEDVKPHPAVKQEVKPETTARPKIKEQTPSKIEVRKEATKGISKKHIWIGAAILVVIVAGVGSYLYFSGRTSKKPVEVATKSEVPKPSENSLPPKQEPKVEEPAKPQSPPIETVPPPVAKPEPSKPSVDITKLEREVNRSLRDNGLGDIYAKVSMDSVATLMGIAGNQEEKDNALSIARSYREIKEVRSNIQIKEAVLPPPTRVDPAKLEGDINRTLRNAGLSGVTAVVNDNLEVILKGSVASNYEKGRAFEIAKIFKDAKKVKDLIFVVEQ